MGARQQSRRAPRQRIESDLPAYFAAMTDSELKSAWMLWGRESESPFRNDRQAALWIAVNCESYERGHLGHLA